MKRETLLITAVIALLLLNLGTLGVLIMGHHERGMHDGPPPPPPTAGRPVDRLIIESVGLDGNQQQQFDQLKREHHNQIIKLDDAYGKDLTDYLQLLRQPAASVATKDSLERAMSQIQVQKASITYEHFSKLRAILRPEQQPKFDSLLPQLIQVIAPPPPPNNLPPPRRN